MLGCHSIQPFGEPVRSSSARELRSPTIGMNECSNCGQNFIEELRMYTLYSQDSQIVKFRHLGKAG